MDKINNRKTRIGTTPPFADNAGMDEKMCSVLFDQAAGLAHQAFNGVTDEHVVTVYHRLLINHQWGLGDAGAVTVH